MAQKIPRYIADNEIFIRFILPKHFRNKKIKLDRINAGELFFDKRGVSLQRKNYLSFKKKLDIIKKDDIDVKGYVFLNYKIFYESLLQIKKKRQSFTAEIKATPLDENDNYRSIDEEISIDDVGKPAHCDMQTTNPDLRESEYGTPNIPLRNFSREIRKNIDDQTIFIVDFMEIDDYINIDNLF